MAELALGTAQFGMNYGVNNLRGRIPEREVCEILKLAGEHDLTLLDTAYLYGESERVIGRCLARLRTHFRIVSKLPPVKELKEVKHFFASSLRRLGVPRLYGYLVHDFKNYLKYPDIWDKLLEFREEGLVEKVGFSLYHPHELEFLFERGIKPHLVQIPLSVLDQRFMTFIPWLTDLGVEIHVRSVFLQGLVFKPPETLPLEFSPVIQSLKRIRELSQRENIPFGAFFLNFVLDTPGVSFVVVGVDGLDHLKALIEAIDFRERVFSLREELLPLAISQEDLILPYRWPKMS